MYLAEFRLAKQTFYGAKRTIYKPDWSCGGHFDLSVVFVYRPSLSWRDVQHIIVRTARPGPANIGGKRWTTNKAGLKGGCFVKSRKHCL